MTLGQSASMASQMAAKGRELRRHQRVKINVLGRFMLEDRQEYPCQVIDMSPGGVAMIAPVQGRIGERVVAYLDHIGRVEGAIVRFLDGGFAVELHTSLRKRDKLANILTWLANRDQLDLPEDRRYDRFVPEHPATTIILPDGSRHECRITDVSLSGAAIHTDVRPTIGSQITLGKMRARVVRHTDEGLAVEFPTIQSRDVLEHHMVDEDTPVLPYR